MRRFAWLVCALVAITACRVDATVDVTVRPDGSGTIGVELVADAELVSRAPGLVDDLRLDDLRRAGWTLDGPTPTPGGGLRAVVAHPFTSVDDADVLLASLSAPGGPLRGLQLRRTVDGRTTSVELTGTLGLGTDLSGFADADALAALGAAPFAAELATAGATVGDVVGVTVRASLPGSVEATSAPSDDLRWAAPGDGSAIAITAIAVRHSGRGVWGALSSIVLVTLVVWAVASAGLIAYVAVARRRRHADHP